MELHPLYLRNPEGLTVAQLKGQLANWPDFDENGEPHRVWIQHSEGLAIACSEVAPLDLTHDDGGESHLLLMPNGGLESLDTVPPAED